MAYRIEHAGVSRSFPDDHAFLSAASRASAHAAAGTHVHAAAHADGQVGVVYLGEDAGAAYHAATVSSDAAFVAIELGTECLGVHTGEDDGPDNVVGFARFRLGDAEPTALVELVKKPNTRPAALDAARAAFEASGLVVAVCNDFPGRILDRLIRPYYNAALRRLDDGLASAADMDKTLRLGLGYPEGPIALLNRTGLHHHHAVTQALYEALGEQAYVPARRAQVAHARHTLTSRKGP